MLDLWKASLLAVGLGVMLGCNKHEPPATLPLWGEALPTQAQPKLPTIRLWIGNHETLAEVATTARQQQTGMMFRTNLAENESMLFVFGRPHRASFWMKNTPLPLSAAFIDPEGVILEIRDLHPHDTNHVIAASERVQYVLETPRNWFQRHAVTPGMWVRTEHGSLYDTFFGGRTRATPPAGGPPR